MYKAHPERDALAHDDAQEAAQEATEAALAQITADIQQLFTQDIRTVPIERLTAPCLGGVPQRRMDVPMNEALDSALCYSVPNARLMAVLAGSDCPLVAELRAAMAAQWVENWASDIAGYAP